MAEPMDERIAAAEAAAAAYREANPDPRTQAGRKKAAAERRAAAKPTMQDIMAKRAELQARGTSVVGQRPQDARGSADARLPAAAVAAQMRTDTRNAEQPPREAGEEVVGDVLDVKSYDPNTATEGQVFGDGGRQWMNIRGELQEINIEGGTAVKAKEWTPTNAGAANQTLAQVDEWISRAATKGNASTLIAQVAPLKDRYQKANAALINARQARDARAIRDAEEDVQNVVDEINTFGNSSFFESMANEAAAWDDAAEQEKVAMERETALTTFRESQVAATDTFNQAVGMLDQQISAQADPTTNGVSAAQQALFEAETLSSKAMIDMGVWGSSEQVAFRKEAIESAKAKVIAAKKTARQQKEAVERQKYMLAHRQAENEILGTTDPWIFATQVAPERLGFDPNSFASEEEMLAAASNLHKQANEEIKRVNNRRAQLRESVAVRGGVTLNRGDIEYIIRNNPQAFRAEDGRPITNPDAVAWLLEQGEFNTPEYTEIFDLAIDDHDFKPEFVVSNMINPK